VSADFYGTCEVVITPELEALLSLCRVIGLRYEITKGEQFWNVSVSARESPADFMSDGRKPNEFGAMLKKSYSVVCITRESDIPHQLKVAIAMAHSALRDSCEHWRRIASTHPDYKTWPQFRKPE